MWSDGCAYANSEGQNSSPTHCVFIRGFRAKRIFSSYNKVKAISENVSDHPDDDPESSTRLVQEPDVPEVGASAVEQATGLMSLQYRDPLIGVLEYIAEVSWSIQRLTIS